MKQKINKQTNTDWWRGAVVYQIYPRSYQDSNNDGIGDLPGITQRLPYLAQLGVDAIWISPFFPSPMKDFGYDVSDYCDVDPMFGTLADFDDLILTAHELGIRIIIDLVLSHTSDQHPWFQESKQDKTNPKADWYVWADEKEDGTPPNNWPGFFGGSAWQWDAKRAQYYLHNFLSSQPDLNFHNPQVQDALLDTTRFWLDRGVDGFRLDTINFYFHDQQLRDNPAIPKENRVNTLTPSVNPYDHQEHIYSKNRPENIAFLERYRALLDEYPGTTCVGEVGEALKSLQLMGDYTKGNDRIHMCYSFEFLNPTRPTAQSLVKTIRKMEEAMENGWAGLAFSNHDVQRHITRWNLSLPAAKTLCSLMMCMKGTPFIYQGEELGLENADIPFEQLQDPYGIEFWPEYKGRDCCRTPMTWEENHQNGGFSDNTPWLPIPHQHLANCVQTQETTPGGILHHYKKAIEFRKAYPALGKGAYGKIFHQDNILVFTREHENATLYCAFNLSENPQTITPPKGQWENIGQELGSTALTQDTLHLGPWQIALAISKPNP